MLHIGWAERYGYSPDKERLKEESLREVRRRLATVLALDPRPLGDPRPLENRVLGTCRDFSVLLCCTLRSQGVPARVRCGFGAYFERARYWDHWVCEYFNAMFGTWVLVDAQIDDFQRRTVGIEFDTLDLPRGQFISGGIGLLGSLAFLGVITLE